MVVMRISVRRGKVYLNKRCYIQVERTSNIYYGL